MSELSLDPQSWLPHRAPFLLLDEMLSIEPGIRAEWSMDAYGDEWFFPGHFPGAAHHRPAYSCSRSLAQCGAVAVLADPKYVGRLPLFGGIERARFRRQGGARRHRASGDGDDPVVGARRQGSRSCQRRGQGGGRGGPLFILADAA